MKIIGCVALVASLLLVAGFGTADQEGAPEVTYSCRIPYDVTDPGQFTKQTAFDIYSWNAFIALNWPADTSTKGAPPCNLQNGVARDCDKPLPAGDYGPTVWETYKPDSAVFRGDAKGAIAPAAWNCPLDPLPGCDSVDARNAAASRVPTLRMIVKDANSAHEFLQAGTFAPLVDQNGAFVRYEMRMNRDEFEYIDRNRLWDSNNHTADVNFQPVGSNENRTMGPIEVKAAWKILGDDDNRERFHAREVEVAWPNPADKGKYLCKQYTMGLVGLHISHKTQSAPQWVWSTFEHVDNYRGEKPSFYDPDCKKCIVNQPPSPPREGWSGDPGEQEAPPTQVQVTDGSAATVGRDAAKINAEVRQKLAALGSVWQYYELVSTQWPSVPYIEGKPAEVYDKAQLLKQGAGQFPHLLANSTMETYLMGPDCPDKNLFTNTSSCMACHNKARIGAEGEFRADFSFLLQEAFPAAAKDATSDRRRQELSAVFQQETSQGVRPANAADKH